MKKFIKLYNKLITKNEFGMFIPKPNDIIVIQHGSGISTTTFFDKIKKVEYNDNRTIVVSLLNDDRYMCSIYYRPINFIFARIFNLPLKWLYINLIIGDKK
jgi:hypothetical protein